MVSLSRLLIALATAAACPAIARAQETPAASAATSGSGATIDEAKRDFQALKASRTTPGQATENLTLPKVDLPSPLPQSAPPARTARDEKKEKAAQLKAKNWLLDAMAKHEKNTPDERGRKRGGSLTERASTSDELTLTGQETPDPLTGEFRPQDLPHEKTPAKPKEAPPLDNPLTPFMAGWISQRDHEALLPKTSATPLLDSSLAQLIDSPGASLPSTSVGGPASVTLPGFSALPASPPALADNPYLKADLPALPAPRVALPAASAALPGPNLPPELKPALVEPPAPAKNAVPAPDLAKPAQDAKYFPQLKRF